jgi:Mrp family chromosome partitioning ATPase
MVVRAFDTTRDVARRALRSLQDVGGKIGGVVLNAVDLEEYEYRYNRYYYQRYGNDRTDPSSWPPPPLGKRPTGSTAGGDLN